MIMDEPVEEQVDPEENMEEHEVILQEDLDSSQFEGYSFFFTTDEIFEEEELTLKDNLYQENVVQIRSQLTRTPQKGLKQQTKKMKTM